MKWNRDMDFKETMKYLSETGQSAMYVAVTIAFYRNEHRNMLATMANMLLPSTISGSRDEKMLLRRSFGPMPFEIGRTPCLLILFPSSRVADIISSKYKELAEMYEVPIFIHEICGRHNSLDLDIRPITYWRKGKKVQPHKPIYSGIANNLRNTVTSAQKDKTMTDFIKQALDMEDKANAPA